MTNNKFFNPTPLYKEYLILDTIDKNKNITQREISRIVGISVSMVNQYLTEYETTGYVVKNYLSVKTIEYFLTDKGVERMKVLNIGYLTATQSVYKASKSETMIFIDKLIEKGFKRLIFYGAGDVAEILLQTINDDNSIPIQVAGVIDDDINKQNNVIVNNKIQTIDSIESINHDAIMIASYNHHEKILEKLLNKNYPIDRIVYFFN